MCIASTYGGISLSFDKVRVYYENATNQYYIDIHYTRNLNNRCGCVITNKSPEIWSTTFNPSTFISVDDTIPETTTMKLEYSFIAD